MAKTKFIVEVEKDAKAIAAYLKIADAQRRVGKGMKDMNREGKKTSQTMSGIGRSIAGWLGGFASIAGVVRGLKAINAEMEKTQRLRKEMYQTALSVEQLSMKIMYLRKDVSETGFETVKKDIADISRQTGLPLLGTASALFFAESAMGAGTAAAKAGALNIGKFGAPAGLGPEALKLLPKMFDILKADTEKKQMVALNKFFAATAASIAEPGEFLQSFIRPLVGGLQRGFTYDQLLAQMVGGIQVGGGVEEAGTAMRIAADVTSARTEKAFKFLAQEAKRRGIDYGKLADPERYEFVRTLLEEAEKGGPESMQRLKTALGSKGFDPLRRIFGEAGRRKYEQVLPEIEKATTETVVQDMARIYLKESLWSNTLN